MSMTFKPQIPFLNQQPQSGPGHHRQLVCMGLSCQVWHNWQ